MKHFNMEEFANGELSRQINRDIETVMRNIIDPNTEVKATRKITVTIGFKVNGEQRDFITTSVNSKPTVAPALGAVTALGVAKNLKTGEIEVEEIGKQVPGQMSIDDLSGVNPDGFSVTTKIDGRIVNTDTGEITGKAPGNSGKVIDLRDVKQA